MDAAVYDALKEKLGDAKIKIGEEEKPLLDLVSYWEEGVEKTKTANKDLTAQREAWEKERKELKESVTGATIVKTDLEKKLEELQKKGGAGNAEKENELQKQINALTDQIGFLKTEYEGSQQKAKELEEKALQANKKASEEGLRNDLITELAKYKIEGERSADAVAIINSQGYAKLVQSDAGLYERSFCTVKDGKQLSATVDQLCKWIAETRPYLVSSSGKPGTNNNHNSNNPAPNSGRNYYSMIAAGS